MALMEEANEFDPTQDLATFQAEREEETRAHRGEVLDRFQTARRKAVGHLHLVATEVAATQEDDVAGTELAAEFYEHVANGLSRSDVAGMFSNQTGVHQAQVVELESVRGELGTAQQQLAESEQTNEQLRASAREASNLQSQLLAVRQELIDSQNKVSELQATNQQLVSDKQSLERQLSDEKQAHGATKDELGTLREQQTGAQSEAQPSPAPEPPAAAPSGEPEKPEPEPGADEPHTGIIDANGGLAAGETQEPLTHKQELGRRRSIRERTADLARDILPGHHSSTTNTPKDGEK